MCGCGCVGVWVCGCDGVRVCECVNYMRDASFPSEFIAQNGIKREFVHPSHTPSHMKAIMDNARFSSLDPHYIATINKRESEFHSELRGLLASLA